MIGHMALLRLNWHSLPADQCTLRPSLRKSGLTGWFFHRKNLQEKTQENHYFILFHPKLLGK